MPKSKGSRGRNAVTIVQRDPRVWKGTRLMGAVATESTAQNALDREQEIQTPWLSLPSFLPLNLLGHPLSKEGKGAQIMQFTEVNLYEAQQTREGFLAGKSMNKPLYVETKTTLFTIQKS